ncbi:MAG: SpoVA/SpoVAEb family sporulation membrane protein [Oscillospiraceae bacterium]|jgi:stage V sporulation protein AC|nr:SpoVA/SpoVAEb family sporulation membrane protein [Oscillospiraceae bacterium]
MKMSKEEYAAYVKKMSPSQPMSGKLAKAFAIGGLICCVGQAVMNLYRALGAQEELASAATTISMVFLGSLLTGMRVYDKLAKHAGAGTLVPVTGFANSVTSPAMEFHSEGIVTGTCAKMFVIAGPVIVFGITASAVYGLVYWFAASVLCG